MFTSKLARLARLSLGSFLCALALGAADPQPEPVLIWNNPPAAGSTLKHGSFNSAAVKAEVGYCVALPVGYAASSRRYPVIYFLHGWGGNENSDGPGIAAAVQRLAAAGEIAPAICVFPNGGQSAYRDDPAKGVLGESLIVEELVPLIDRIYRTDTTRGSRVIAGFSMGGAGALSLSLKHPELFSAAASWAAALDMPIAGGPGAEIGEEHLRELHGSVRLLMIVGSDDDTSTDHVKFLRNLGAAKYPFVHRVLPGIGHDLGAYQRLTSDELLHFLAVDFKKDVSPAAAAQ